MDTSILHTRIKEYKARATHHASKEMILLFESWFTAIENYISDIEIDNFYLMNKIRQKDETINLLCDLLIVSGNIDKISSLNFKDPYTLEAIKLLLKSKDRINHQAITSIAYLLHTYSDKKFKTITELKKYVDGI